MPVFLLASPVAQWVNNLLSMQETEETSQYSNLGNPMDRGAWWALVHGVAKNLTQPKDLITTTKSFLLIFLILLYFSYFYNGHQFYFNLQYFDNEIIFQAEQHLCLHAFSLFNNILYP